MKKLLKKSLSCILALTLIVSALPMFALAEEGESTYSFPTVNFIDATSVRGKGEAQGQSVILGGTSYYGGMNDNYRVGFYKFDFSNFSETDLLHIKDMNFYAYYTGAGSNAYQGINLSILPPNLEDFDNTIVYATANERGMLSSDIKVIATNPDGVGETNVGYKKLEGVGSEILSHLSSDTDDKVVWLRLSSTNNNGVFYLSSITDTKYPHPYFEIIPVESETEYVQNLANTVTFEQISEEPIYAVTKNLNLSAITLTDDVTLTWASSDTNVISNDGTVTPSVEAKAVTLKATIASKSDSAVSVSKTFRVTVEPNDGADTKYYWDFDNDKGLKPHYSSADADFMSGLTNKATVASDPIDSANSVANVSVTNNLNDSLTGVTVPADSKYLAFRADAYVDEVKGKLAFAIRDSNDKITTLAQVDNNVINQWQKLLTVIDLTTPSNSNRYRLVNGDWVSYAQDFQAIYEDFTSANIVRITFSGYNAVSSVLVDNFSIKAYDDFYAEVNAATTGNVIAVVEAFDNMGIIELPAAYASADKVALAAAIKANTSYASDDEVMLSIEKALSDGSIIIGKETVSANVLTEVKFATKEAVANPKIYFIAASYNAANELVAISTAEVSSVSTGWNTASLNLSLADSAKIKYMLWSDVDTTIKPIVASTLK